VVRFELYGPMRVHPHEVVRYELEPIGVVDSLELAVRGMHGCQKQTLHHDFARAEYWPRGTTGRFPIDVVIPPFPSHSTPFAWSGLWLDVRAGVGTQLIDLRYPLHVCEPIVERNLEPAVARTRQFVELALGLAATRVTGGMTLAGQCSIAGLTSDSRIELEVICLVRAATGGVRRSTIHASKLHVPRHATTVPFTVELPAYLAPSLAIDTHQIAYEVIARHKQWRGTTSVSLPLHVVDAFPVPARVRPPDLGERAIEQVFEQIAARGGWQIGPSVDADPQLGTIMPWLFAAHGGVVMRLGHAFRADGSTFLVSRIRYQPLELGLHVVRGKSGGDVRSGVASWDRDHAVSVRDLVSAHRATELVTAVVPCLEPLGRLVRWDDDWLVCERAVTGIEHAVVDEVATALRRVAGEVARAIRSNELPVGPYR
jgi:hypothetical protein